MDRWFRISNRTSESMCLHSVSIRSRCCDIAGRKILNELHRFAVLGTYGVIAATQMGGSKDARRPRALRPTLRRTTLLSTLPARKFHASSETLQIRA